MGPVFAPAAVVAPDAVLTRGEQLSAEAERLRSWLGLPISLLPIPRSGRRCDLRDFVLDVNHLIAGKVERLLPWDLLAGAFAPATLDGLRGLFRGRFAPLWNEEESAAMRRAAPAEVAAQWRRRSREGAWAPSLRTIAEGADLQGIWGELDTGDFDVTGRGRDYTEGMHYFQAARAMGVETLLEHMGAFGWEDGCILDVLGGDGYILRIFEAIRKLRNLPLYVGECSPEGFGEDLGEGAAEAAGGLVERCGGGLVLVLQAAAGAAGARAARWVAVLPSGVQASAPFTLPAEVLAALRGRCFALPRGRRPGDLLRPAGELAAAAVAAAAGPRVITNDISPHMFFSAGLWGLPTREDARRLTRTFRAGSLDAVVFAYGTHHVTGIDEAIRQSFAVLRPGGHVVLQDFLDEGQVGDWFHHVVHPYSRTGHDFAHLGPVQLAVQLFLAGFRDVRMFEMEDPFMFAVPHGSSVGARTVACTYLLGMYGLGESFLRDRHQLEGRIREILSYDEIGNTPLFDDDFVYVPRRATGASAVRPQDGRLPLSPADRALVAALSGLLALDPGTLAERFDVPPELLAAWFREDGSRWGVTAREAEAWFAQAEVWRRQS